jgi:hypothetical protein
MNNHSTNPSLPIVNQQGSDQEMMDQLQRDTFLYFVKEVNAKTGLIADKTQAGSPASITSVGLGLSCYVAAVEGGYMARDEAIKRTLTVLDFLNTAPQSVSPDATGYKGFYYHFLDMGTGKRAGQSELSTIDTAILMAGILTAQNYYTGTDSDETQIRHIANELYTRVDWQWALDGGDTLSHGWMPESGFLPYRWDLHYSEAHILYILALGSPTFAISPTAYAKWIDTLEWMKLYDIECFYAGPLFIHQMSQIWLDLRGINDDANKKAGIDYFENSSRATRIQQKYAIENPMGFAHYSANGWGFTASDGPGPAVLTIDGVQREFYNYIARGIPFGPDDGTISPWAVATSLPFAPEIVLATLRHAIERLDLKKHSKYGFDGSFNPTYPEKTTNRNGWISEYQFGLNQGPVILMIENYKSQLIWKTIKKSPYIINGLRRAGFTGGWLDMAN